MPESDVYQSFRSLRECFFNSSIEFIREVSLSKHYQASADVQKLEDENYFEFSVPLADGERSKPRRASFVSSKDAFGSGDIKINIDTFYTAISNEKGDIIGYEITFHDLRRLLVETKKAINHLSR